MKTHPHLRLLTSSSSATAVASVLLLSTALALVPVAAHSAVGDLYLTDRGAGPGGSDLIDKFTPTGGAPSTFAGGSGPNSIFQTEGLAFDTIGNLYVSSGGSGGAGNGSIIKFLPGNGGSGSPFATGLSNPNGLAFDAAGNLYEADFGSGTIFKITSGGVKSTFASGLSNPGALAFDAAGNLFEADTGSHAILKFTNTGGTLSNTPSTFASLGNLNTATGLAFDSAGNLFEAQQGFSGTINKFAPNGSETNFANTANNPVGLAFDSAGNLFDTESNGTINKFTNTGGTLSNTSSVFASSLSNPQDLAFQPAVVPEPATGTMVLGALGLLLGCQRFARRSRNRNHRA